MGFLLEVAFLKKIKFKFARNLEVIPTEGMKCIVYRYTVRCKKPEGKAVIVKVLSKLNMKDKTGRTIYHCLVHFEGDEKGVSVPREVSHFF